MSVTEEISTLLETSSEKVNRNVEVVYPETIGQNFVLHISKDTKIKKFVPVIGTRQGTNEDRTMPRVCTSDNLYGCMLGYASTHNDVAFLLADGDSRSSNGGAYKGGWAIYEIEFEAALKPNKNLVYDAGRTDEIWLVSYNRKTVDFIPKLAGKMFYSEVRYQPRTGDAPLADGTLIIEVIKAEGIRFSDNIFLDRGYWKIEGPMVDNISSFKRLVDASKNTSRDGMFKVFSISPTEYSALKNQAAALLGFSDKLPNFLKW